MLGVPIIHLRVFPLDAKRMHAMAAKAAGRHAILLGHDAHYPALVAFTLAHEIGHIMLGHIASSSAIIDVGDPLGVPQGDAEEEEADRYALELLLGTSRPDIRTNVSQFSSCNRPSRARARAGPADRTAHAALCLAFSKSCGRSRTPRCSTSIRNRSRSGRNSIRSPHQELDLAALSDDDADYLRNIMGIGND